MTAESDEQRAVADCPAAAGAADDIVLVQAYAGAGKTTTLQAYVERRPRTRFLYLCFNRTVQQSAEARFVGGAGDVDCRTLDSLALEYAESVARRHQSSGAPRRSVRDATRALIADELSAVERDAGADAAGVLRLLVAYCADASHRDAPSTACFDALVRDMSKPAAPASLARGRRTRQPSMDAAIRLWTRLVRGETSWFDHAVNRKLLFNDGVDAAGWNGRWDEVLVDECQDLSPMMVAIVVDGFRGRKLFVGDRHQHIYSFMGSVDAFDTLAPRASHSFALAASYRFGARIADVATRLVRRRHPNAPAVVGVAAQDAVTCAGIAAAAPTTPAADGGGAFVVLCRKNVNVFVQAVMAARAQKRVHVYGQEALVERVRSLYAAIGTDRWMRTLGAARREDDVDTLRLMRHIERDPDEIVDSLAALRRQAVPRESDAEVVFSTVHKAKGGEWDRVKVHEDVFSPLTKANADANDDDDALNIAYVACTRARRHLNLPRNGYELLFGGAVAVAPPTTADGNDDDVRRWRSSTERKRPTPRTRGGGDGFKRAAAAKRRTTS